MTQPADAGQSAWQEACLVAALLAVAPIACGGVSIKAQAGPVRDRWLDLFKTVCPAQMTFRRLPVNAAPQRVFGGLDLTATLNAGYPVTQRGLLSEVEGGMVIAAMAERMEPAMAAQIAGVMESGQLIVERDGLQLKAKTSFGMIALDEARDDEPGLAASLREQLAFDICLDEVSAGQSQTNFYGAAQVQAARERLAQTRLEDQALTGLCEVAMALGVGSLRASLMAARVARLHAALHGRTVTSTEDAEAAVRLVLVPRATQLPEAPPQPDEQPEQQQPPREQQSDGETADREQITAEQLSDILVEAAKAALPADLLARHEAARQAAAAAGMSGSRAGARCKSATRGRPVGTRAGELRPGSKLDIVETLRVAAPWQALRRRQREAEGKNASLAAIEIRKQDFRLKRFQQPAESTAIFIVDASGSSALNRLAEAKGAVELLLAECYVRRDQVALIAFRDDKADLLLPPTRSLVRAKGSLSALAGGGGTPLANAIDAGLLLSETERRRGRTPIMVLLTDGQANVARDGKRERAAAREDATDAARRVRRAGVRSLLLDISPRPSRPASLLAAEMGATHVPLPYADAKAVSSVVRAHVEAAPALAPAV
jgi:magnesium chelatase subunit D